MGAKESTLRSRCKSSLYNPLISSWHDIKSEIVTINKFHFRQCAFSEDELRTDFTDPRCVAVITTDMLTGGIIGYTYTTPLLKYHENMDWELSRADNGTETAYLWQIALDEEYIGNGLVGSITGALESELLTKGYSYLELSARIKNGYAAKVTKNNRERILYQETFIDELSGEPLTFFRIDLLKRH